MDSEPRRSFLDRLKILLGLPRANTTEDLEREIAGIVDQGEAHGLITAREGRMIEAVLDLGETTAGQIMVPRIDTATVPSTSSVEEVLRVLVDSGHSRIPIYSDDLDHIQGVLHAKDLLPFWGRPPEEIDLLKISRAPFFVPQSMPINQLLAEFRRQHVHLAVVVDEYGGTAGIVTMEDILEEIVGEIVDEYDNEESLLAEQADGSVLVDARLEVEDLAEHLGIDLPTELPEGRFETVGGFITTVLGRVPAAQEEVAWGPVRMVVVGADQRRVTQVQVFTQEPQTVQAGD